MRRATIALAMFLLPSIASALPPIGPSEVIFPPQRLPIRFSHKQHLGFKLECDFCHDSAAASTSAADNLIPSEDACSTCHKIDRDQPDKKAKPAARCDACHLGADPVHPERVVVPPPNLKFNHKVHVDRKIACERCHGPLTDVDLATRTALPRMPLCLGCHNSTTQIGRAPARCATCHLTRPDSTLETSFASGLLAPSGNLKGDAHTPRFAMEHARVAQQDGKYCANCHRQDFCLSCHNGVVRPLSFHGSDYVTLHAVDARKQTTDCNGCHRRQTFCLGCHERAGVTDPATVDAPGSVTNLGRRFHPPRDVWVNSPRTPAHHSWQAERNLRQCVACHREDTCMECHSLRFPAAQYQVSPHPANFAQSGTCRALADRNKRVCLKCHQATDTARLSCQPGP